MQAAFTISWVDDWLAGLVHRRAAEPIERSRHERFIVARTVTTLAALASLPAYMLGRGAPTQMEALSLVGLAAPLVAVVALSRFGRLAFAQGLVSAALTLFAAGLVVAFGGPASPALLALLIVPLDALLAGSRRGLAMAFAFAALGVPLAAGLQAGGLVTGHNTALASAFAVGLAFALGHGIAQAVMERRLAGIVRAALQAGEAREGASLQAIDDLVTWHDAQGLVLRANTAAMRLVGVPAASLQGHGLFGRIHVPDRPAYLKAISDAARSSETVVVQIRLMAGEPDRPEGEHGGAFPRIGAKPARPLVAVELRAHRLPGDDAAAVIAVTRDVSGHHDRAEDLDRLRREAVAAGESRAQLLSTVSHELRTPLNAILGYSELLMGRQGAESGRGGADYAEIIHRSGHHMLGVVSTLLDLSTIEAGHYALSPEPIEVAELVAECGCTMRLAADQAGVAIAEDVAPNLPPLHADRRACQQILLNLLSNAVKFTPRGGLVTVQVRQEGTHLSLAVRDTGIGVLATELPRLGVPFFRAAAARSRCEKGSGLGLSVVRGLVALHGGRLTIASTPGDGTSVTVVLPLEAKAGEPHAEPVAVLPFGAKDGNESLTIARPESRALTTKTG
ncbi:MAG TPA: PAS domain-containing sensor histidine kinase [Microvirga sp.]